MTDANSPSTGQHTQLLEIARWPEWGVERWEETDRAASCPDSGLDEQKPMGDIAAWEDVNQIEAALPPIPAETGKAQPANKAAKIAGGIVLGLLLLGGGISTYQMSSARALDLQPVPVDSPRGISLDLPAGPVPGVDASITPAQALPVPTPAIRNPPSGLSSKSRRSQVSALGHPNEARAVLPESRCDSTSMQRRGDGEGQDLIRAEWADWHRCEERRIHSRP
jgi:hypothetical protein